MAESLISEPSWRATKLSLERPYKDDSGKAIPTLLDIGQDGQFIYEPQEDWDARLGQKFRRIFAERGIDFFERSSEITNEIEQSFATKQDAFEGDSDGAPHGGDPRGSKDAETKPMTPEMLFRMRNEILPQLHVAYGEMSQARDLLTMLLSASSTSSSSTIPTSSSLLSASSITKLPPISSVQSFDARLVTGGKDDALRKASDVLKIAAEVMERGSAKGDKFWANALEIRRANWGLITAPLPLGSAVGKGAEKTSKDFLISFGLEQSSPILRQRGIAHMSFFEGDDSTPIIFPHRIRTRLRVSLTRKDSGGLYSTCHSRVQVHSEDDLDGAVKAAQKELVEQEIFGELIKEAGDLPTVSARVSERLVVMDSGQGVELRFELVDSDVVEALNSNLLASSSDVTGQATCDLIYSMLHVLLLRAHAYSKSYRLGAAGVMRAANAIRQELSHPILRPIVDLLQYKVFCERIRGELDRGVQALREVGVPVSLRFDAIGEDGAQAIRSLADDERGKIGGEAVLRINDRHSIRLTFVSPSTLVAHLLQATITIVSVPQLRQLMVDEFERSLLGRICSIGTEVCESISGTWFVDEMMCRSVGRWEGAVLTFRIKCADDFKMDCLSYRLLSQDQTKRTTFSNTEQLSYESREDKTLGLFSWVRHIIENTLSSS